MPEVYPEFGFRGLVPTVPMPRSPYLYPVEPPFFYAKKAREATDGTPSSNRNLPPQVLTTRNVTFTATKLAAMIQHSTELEEDTIVALASAIRAGLGMAIEAAIESCWINGQSTAISGTTSTFDTGETFDDGSSTLLEDQRRSWNGIRYGCSLTGVVEDASTGFTVDNVSNVAARLGRFGKVRRDTLFVTGYIGEARCLTLRDAHNTAVVLTADKAGGAGTFQTGIMYAMFGRPLYISNEWPENLNGAGVADGGGGTFTSIGLVNTKRIRHGEVRMTRIEASRDWNFAQDQVAVRATYRGVGQFTVTPSATDKSMGLIVGIK
jgi:hypothetical protein